MARPGDTVQVADGTYEEAVVTHASGTAEARIVYRAQTPLGVVINASGHYTAWRNLGDHVDIVGFDVLGADYLGIFNEGSFVRIVGNRVHDLAVPTCNAPRGGAAIDHGNYEAEGNLTIGNVVHDIVPPGDFCNLIHGIYHANRGGAIQNNIVFGIAANGIQTWHAATGVTIANNLVFDSHRGINVGSSDARGTDYLVTNNIVIRNVFGIVENGRLGRGNLYLNNLLYENGTDFVLRIGEERGTIRSAPRMRAFRSDGKGDYRLGDDSPGLDAGVENGAPAFDIAGTGRPQGDGVDIGPYECPCP